MMVMPFAIAKNLLQGEPWGDTEELPGTTLNDTRYRDAASALQCGKQL